MTDERGRSITLGLLSSAAGVMDATAFLALGDVFTSAMSGNTILLGIALGQGRMSAALHALAAFLGYACGVALAALPLRSPARGIERTVGLEAMFLAAFAGAWTVAGGPVGTFAVYALIVLSAIAMGLQGAVGRALGIPGIPTIVVTSTLTAIIGPLADRALGGHRKVTALATRQQLVSFLAYLSGAVFAGCVVSSWLHLLPFVPLGLILIAVTCLRLRLARL